MLSSDTDRSSGNMRQLVEVFENERYIPISGWGKNLLASDRHIYSNRDGSVGFPTLEEYETAMKSVGWEYDVVSSESWMLCKDDKNTDEEGWSYSVDFGGFNEKEKENTERRTSRSSILYVGDPAMSAIDQNALVDMELQNTDNNACVTPSGGRKVSISSGTTETRDSTGMVGDTTSIFFVSNGSAEKSMVHFVRRRRLLRWQQFDLVSVAGTSLAAQRCDYCDLQEVDNVSAMLLNTLSEASVIAHPRLFDEAKANALKSRLIASLDLMWTQEQETGKGYTMTITGTSDTCHNRHLSDYRACTNIITIILIIIIIIIIIVTEYLIAVEEAKLSDGQKTLLNKPNDGQQSPYSAAMIESKCQPFIESCNSTWSSLSSSLSSTSTLETNGRRVTDIANNFFLSSERHMLATIIIRRFVSDPESLAASLNG